MWGPDPAEVFKLRPIARGEIVVKSIGWYLSLLLAALMVFAAAPPNLEKALEVQRRLVEERPQDPGVFNDLGNLLVLAGSGREAEVAYRMALELDPYQLPTHFNLGLLLQSQRRLDDALAAFQALLDIEPNHAWTHYQIGTVLAERGQRDAAVAAYARALSLDPNLAFSDVNPHIIGNKLFTEALLRANRGRNDGVLAPRSYVDPSRIADILIPPPELSGNEEELPAEAPESSQAVEEDSRSLTSADLDPRSNINKATPQDGAQPGLPVGVRRPPVTINRPSVRSFPGVQRNPGTTTGPVTPAGRSPQGDPQAPPGQNPGGSQPKPSDPFDRNYLNKYKPDRPSSSRLELKLLPAPEDPAAEA